MCGIAGFWDRNNKTQDLKKEIIAMTNSLAHRGPDDEGIFIDENRKVALGHRRLSILDLSSAGHQPMKSNSGRYVIIYNGEIYNYKNLRKEIEAKYGAIFRSSTDTEVLLAAIENWGIEKALEKSNGMFAFALWDRKENRLFLARDRIGIKPLYYGINNNIFYFASELKAIRANSLFVPEINKDALALYFRHNYIPVPYAIYKGINKLRPGHYITIDGNLNIEEKYYWSAEKISTHTQNILQLSEVDVVSEVENLLADSIRMRMIADVPLGTFLSGGIDSSIVAALMQKESRRPIKTFTIGFYENDYNEARFAKAVAHHLGTDHTELYTTPKEAMDIILRLADIYDEPFSDSSQIPTFLISQLTKNYVTVSLSGDGGDELFGGYNRYFWGNYIWKSTRYIPAFIKRSAAKILLMMSNKDYGGLADIWLLSRFLKQPLLNDKLFKLAEILDAGSEDKLYKRLISHWRHPHKLVREAEEPNTVLDHKTISKLIPNFTGRMMFFDLITYLPDDILTKVDRASMAVSLEVRVPLLDHRLVELSKKIPLSLKIKKKKGKWILRQILYKYVPPKLIERPKMGFSIPLGDWLRNDLKGWANSLLDEKKLKKDGILNPQPIKKLWQEHLTKKRNWQYLLWDVLMFQAWKEKWM
mgnify:CR=1 FL=1